MDESMHMTVVRIELWPESSHVALVVAPVWLRVVPVQGIGNQVSCLESSRCPGVSEHRNIREVPQGAERAAGDPPLIRPILEGSFDVAAVMDDQSPLLLAISAHAVHEVVELLG